MALKSSATSSASLTAISSGVWVLMAKRVAAQRNAALRAEIGDVPLRVNPGVRAAAAGEVHRRASDLLQRLCSVSQTVTAFFCTCQPW